MRAIRSASNEHFWGQCRLWAARHPGQTDRSERAASREERAPGEQPASVGL